LVLSDLGEISGNGYHPSRQELVGAQGLSRNDRNEFFNIAHGQMRLILAEQHVQCPNLKLRMS
jgi:hypothetical protein